MNLPNKEKTTKRSMLKIARRVLSL